MVAVLFTVYDITTAGVAYTVMPAVFCARDYSPQRSTVGQLYSHPDRHYHHWPMRAQKLPITFDVEQLKDDLYRLEQNWVAHHRPDHSRQWDAVQLRSIAGDPQNGRYSKDASAFAFTDAYDHCRYVPQVLEQLGCPTKRVRFMRLAAGGAIKRHVDAFETLYYGQVRLHIPVITSPLIRFFVAGLRVNMQAGEVWYLNALHRHWVQNHSDIDRIHLVVDCVVNDRLREMIENSATKMGLVGERVVFAIRPALLIKDTMLQRAAPF